MSKTKSNGVKAAKPEKDVLTKVKDAGVTKPAHTVKAKTKDLAKSVAVKEDKKSKKKAKVPTPEPESESDVESDSASESESEPESDESGSESETEIKPAINGKKALNGAAKVAKTESESDASESSDESSDSEAETPVVAAASAESDESEEDSDESDSSDSEEEEAPTKTNAAKADKAKITSKESDEGHSSDDSSEADSESESDEESEPEVSATVGKKRKAEDESPFAAKKAKAEAEASTTESGNNLFVGNLSWNVDEEWLSQEFGEFGELAGVRVVTDKQSGRSKGFGYVEFVNAADAAKAYKAKKDTEIDNRKVNIDWASGRSAGGGADRVQDRAKSFGDKTSPPSETLFVGNLAFSVDQNTVSEAFAEFGEITGVRLPTDRETGAPKGFGYVTFSSVDEAKAAFDGMQGYELAGRTVRLDYSAPRPSNGDSPARGRGGFGGGFGGGRGGGGRGGRGGFTDRGGRGGGRGGRGNARGGRGGSFNRGGFGDFSGKKTSFD